MRLAGGVVPTHGVGRAMTKEDIRNQLSELLFPDGLSDWPWIRKVQELHLDRLMAWASDILDAVEPEPREMHPFDDESGGFNDAITDMRNRRTALGLTAIHQQEQKLRGSDE